MRLTVGTRTRIIADLTFEFDPTNATVELELDDSGVWHPATWTGPAVVLPSGDWTREAQSDEFFIGGESDGSAVALPIGRHFTTARVTLAGQPYLAPSTIIDVVAESRFVTVDELRDQLANAGGAGSRTAAELPDDRIAVNLEEATDEVLGAIGAGGYVIADGVAPPAVRSIVLGIGSYLATLEFYGSQPLEDRDPVVLRYTRAQQLLARVASGKVEVLGVDKEAGTGSGDAEIYQGTPNLRLAETFAADEYGGRINTAAHFGGAVWE